MEVELDSTRHRQERSTCSVMGCCCPQRPSKQTRRPADSDAFDNGEEISVQKLPYENKFGVRVTKNAPTYRHATNRALRPVSMRLIAPLAPLSSNWLATRGASAVCSLGLYVSQVVCAPLSHAGPGEMIGSLNREQSNAAV